MEGAHVLTATEDLLLPTTVTGSWPRPSWFTGNLNERPFSSAMADVRYREQFVDAVGSVLNDQEFAGLDILTNGDYHLDNDLAGRSWFSYPSERFDGISQYDSETTFGWSYPIGSWLNEIVGGWKYHAVVDKIGPRAPLEFAKIWRVAQARSAKPVKFGTIAADLAATVLTIKTDAYAEDKQDLMWDIATILNGELRALAAAGCKVIQIEEPAIHSSAAYGASAEVLDFLVELFNHTVEGLDDVELWIHTCWGNPGAQHCFDPQISYEPSVDIYLNRLKGDVWTIESKENGHSLLPAFKQYKGNLPKKVAVGMISHRRLQVETPEDIATDIRTALEHIDADKLVLSSDCGFGRQGVPRPIAMYKAAALAQGANIVRGELGATQTHVPAADPAFQVDVPAREPEAVGA
jgi:5-methyltetrahydropteroyltriglutamate--homocysteine methyltransferase